MSETDTRDRVIRLEEQVKHLSDVCEKLTDAVTELTNLLNQAKGAKWVLIGAASLGGFVAAKVSAFLPWLAGLPK